ncbi:MAG: alpha amylase C-terminal domain-containing protein [Kiritimatiellae bacterium]|nr:alpha amylase C-terminal domain-containing protein [Kiritimatiellia bacterium]
MIHPTRLLTCLVAATLLSSASLTLAQSSRPGMGAIPYSDGGTNGVTFRTWAPNASSVAVRGDFNGWGQTALTSEGNGNWSVDINGAVAGQQYQYFLNGNLWKRDPRSRRVSNSAGNSIIYNRNAFDWGDATTPYPYRNDTVIYQMHAGTFNAEGWVPSTFDVNLDRIEHLQNLGVSVVQLMPVNEFAADKSWGYNPADIFAIESALGGPDALKRFVKALNQRGIAVFMDVVHNHYGPSDLSLWQFDGWNQNNLGGIYFYNQYDKASTWWGDTRPDFGRSEVRSFIRDQIFMFVEEFHISGFRWDSVFNMIYYNSGGNHLPDGESLLRDINWELEQNYPGVVRIAEDHAFDFNMNFHSQWDVGFHDHLKWQVTQSTDAGRNMGWMADRISQNASHSRVLFSESHDSVGDLNQKQRLPRDIDGGDPTSIWARKRQLLAASIVMTTPGIPMIFQGQEMNEDWTFSAETALRWSLATQFSGIVDAYSGLIHARRNLRGGTQGLKGTGVNVHHIDDVNKVLGFIRWDAGGGADDVVVVANFSATKFQSGSYQIEFPSEGLWYCHFNGDSTSYGADFDGIGGADVMASGSPAMGTVNMGMYAVQIFSKTPPNQSGLATFDPAQPSGCDPITITFDPADGPLNGAVNVYATIARNGWQDGQDVQMSWNGSAWETVFEVTNNTWQIDLFFHNGAPTNEIFDNNLGRDWHLTVADCGAAPRVVTLSPTQPQGCVPVTIRYDAGGDVLSEADPVYIYLGRNSWQETEEIAMTQGIDNVWSLSYQIPDSTWQIDFVFNDGAITNKVWDNNQGSDWHITVLGCIQAEAPGLVITNPASDISVSNTITQYELKGTSVDMVGDLSWTNSRTGDHGLIPVAASWSVPAVPVEEGVNLIRVSGTNDTDNPNAGLYDSADDLAYTAGWTNQSNGGTGWPEGWTLIAVTNAGHFIAGTNEANNSLGQAAWGLWANSEGISEAIRTLPSSLHVGDVFSMRFDNNWISGGKSVGVGFQNSFGQNLFEFLFIGDGSNYVVNESSGIMDTGIGWSDAGHDLEFELLAPNLYRFRIGTHDVLGELQVSSLSAIDRIRIWNYSAGGGWEYNLYVDDLAVNGTPLQSTVYNAEVTITRQTGPYGDPDQDGFLNWEEEIAGTNPNNAQSRLPDILMIEGHSAIGVEIPESIAGRYYDLFMTTNILGSHWAPLGIGKPGTGGAIMLNATNQADQTFYRTGVRQTP